MDDTRYDYEGKPIKVAPKGEKPSAAQRFDFEGNPINGGQHIANQPALSSIEGQQTGVKVLPPEVEAEPNSGTNKLAAWVQENHPEVSKILSYLPSHPEWMATGPPIVAEGAGAAATKAAQIFQNLRRSGAFMDATGGVSPRTYHMLRFFSKLKDAMRGGPAED